MKSKKNNYTIAFLVISLVVNIFLLAMFLSESAHFYLKHENYPFLSKRIFTQKPNDVIINFIPLRKTLREYVAGQKDSIGLYFEYLPSGVSIGVNEKDEMKLSSLSKVPLAMSILKKVEKGQIKLDDIVYLKKENLNQNFGTLWKKGEGAKVSIKELIEESLINSDNTAYRSLLAMLTSDEVIDVYNNLEIEVYSKDDEPFVSTKGYSSIFRSLYLSSYISEKNSNYLLDVLSRTSFTDKIPSGVTDKKIKVSHKIGVFSRADTNDEQKIFSDCGIVYFPNRPYILCVFVKDSDDQAKKHISYISRMIYEYIKVVPGGN